MTTASWATRVRMDSDAAYREWGSELNTKLAAIGLVQTADTGQVNWTTITKPGTTNTINGYEIWRFGDAMQATAPIFFRIDYGQASTNAPFIKITVGTGSNGSGTITGTALAPVQTLVNGNIALTTDVLLSSYACHVSGFFGLSWKVGAAGSTEGFFVICRTCDASGTPDGTGALVLWFTGANPNCQALRFAATAKAYTLRNGNSMQLCLFPQSGDGGSSLVGTDIQCYMCWTITPRVAPLFGLCGVVSTEVSVGVTFSATLVGSSARTYIAVTSGGGSWNIAQGAGGNLRPAMIWE